MKNLALTEKPQVEVQNVGARENKKLKTSVKAGAYSGSASALYMFTHPTK